MTQLHIQKSLQLYDPTKSGGLFAGQIGVVQHPEDILSLADNLTYEKTAAGEAMRSRHFTASSWHKLQRKVPSALKEFVQFVHLAEREIFGRIRSPLVTREISLSVTYCPQPPTSLYETYYWPSPKFIALPPEEKPSGERRVYSACHPFDPTYVVGTADEPVSEVLGILNVPITRRIGPYNKKISVLYQQGRLGIISPSRGAICADMLDTITRRYSEEEAQQNTPYAKIAICIEEKPFGGLIAKIIPSRRFTLQPQPNNRPRISAPKI